MHLLLSSLTVLVMITTLTTAIDVTIPVKGGAQRITINNGYCYVCSYANGITIIDMQALGGPQIVGNYSKYYANTITFRDKRAYLGAGADGFILLDVSDPIKLLFIKQWKLSNGFVTQVDSSNGLAYVADFNKGFYVLEMVTLPGKEIQFSVLSYKFLTSLWGVRAKGPKYCIASAALVGSPLYGDSNTNLGNIGSSEELVFGEGTDDHIYSVESTAHRFEIYNSVSRPKRVFVNFRGTTVSVAVRGTLAYVATKEKGLCIYTVRDPSAASILSCTAMPSGTVARSVAVDRNSDTVAVSLGANGIRFLNLNNNSTLSPTDVPTQLPIPVTEVPTTPIPNGGTRSPTDSPSGGQATSSPSGGQATSSPTSGNGTSSPSGGQATSSPSGGQATSSPSGGQATSSPTSSPSGNGTSSPSGGQATSSPSGGQATSSPTSSPSGGQATSSPTSSPSGGQATSSPTSSPSGNGTSSPSGGQATSSPSGGQATSSPTSSPSGGQATSSPTSSPSGGQATSSPTSSPSGGNGTNSPGSDNETNYLWLVFLLLGLLVIVLIILVVYCCIVRRRQQSNQLPPNQVDEHFDYKLQQVDSQDGSLLA